MLMPIARYTYERIPPLNEARYVEQHLTALYNLTELAEASKILLGAQYRSKGVLRFLYSLPPSLPDFFIVKLSLISQFLSHVLKVFELEKFKFVKKFIWSLKIQIIYHKFLKEMVTLSCQYKITLFCLVHYSLFLSLYGLELQNYNLSFRCHRNVVQTGGENEKKKTLTNTFVDRFALGNFKGCVVFSEAHKDTQGKCANELSTVSSY